MKITITLIIASILLIGCYKVYNISEEKSSETNNVAAETIVSVNTSITGIPEVLTKSPILAPVLLQAKTEGKNIIIDFTGSDWCGWCIKLDNEILNTEAFKEGISADFIFVKLDFPRNIPQTDEVKATNKAIAGYYEIKGYPTLIITDAEGKLLGQTGYRELTPEEYVDHLKTFIQK